MERDGGSNKDDCSSSSTALCTVCSPRDATTATPKTGLQESDLKWMDDDNFSFDDDFMFDVSSPSFFETKKSSRDDTMKVEVACSKENALLREFRMLNLDDRATALAIGGYCMNIVNAAQSKVLSTLTCSQCAALEDSIQKLKTKLRDSYNQVTNLQMVLAEERMGWVKERESLLRLLHSQKRKRTETLIPVSPVRPVSNEDGPVQMNIEELRVVITRAMKYLASQNAGSLKSVATMRNVQKHINEERHKSGLKRINLKAILHRNGIKYRELFQGILAGKRKNRFLQEENGDRDENAKGNANANGRVLREIDRNRGPTNIVL